MKDLINRMRLCAEDLHSISPASETVKCLSEGADALERLANEAKFGWDAHALMLENARLRARIAEAENDKPDSPTLAAPCADSETGPLRARVRHERVQRTTCASLTGADT